MTQPRPQGVWRLAWRRFRRDRVAVASAAFLGLLLFAIFPGATIASALLGHGPNDLFPYAVSVSLKPAGPLTVVPNLHSLPPSSAAFSFHHPKAPPGTGRTILLLGADGSSGATSSFGCSTAAAFRSRSPSARPRSRLRSGSCSAQWLRTSGA